MIMSKYFVEEQEKWNVKSMDKTASKKEIFNKKKKN